MRQYFLCLYEGFDLALMVFYFLVERNYNLFDFQVGPPEIPDLSFNYTGLELSATRANPAGVGLAVDPHLGSAR